MLRTPEAGHDPYGVEFIRRHSTHGRPRLDDRPPAGKGSRCTADRRDYALVGTGYCASLLLSKRNFLFTHLRECAEDVNIQPRFSSSAVT